MFEQLTFSRGISCSCAPACTKEKHASGSTRTSKEHSVVPEGSSLFTTPVH